MTAISTRAQPLAETRNETTHVLDAGDPFAPVVPGMYRHFKGADYQVLFIATAEADGSRHVIYQRVGDDRVWSMPLGDFTCVVVGTNGPCARFTHLIERTNQ